MLQVKTEGSLAAWQDSANGNAVVANITELYLGKWCSCRHMMGNPKPTIVGDAGLPRPSLLDSSGSWALDDDLEMLPNISLACWTDTGLPACLKTDPIGILRTCKASQCEAHAYYTRVCRCGAGQIWCTHPLKLDVKMPILSAGSARWPLFADLDM